MGHNKRVRNLELRGFDFEDAELFDWAHAQYMIDSRFDYGETRVIATGLFEGRRTVMIYTPRGDWIRIISWRKANSKEAKRYGN